MAAEQPVAADGAIALPRFLAPAVVADHRNAPVNALGYLRVMFTVEDIDDTLARRSTPTLGSYSNQLVNYDNRCASIFSGDQK
jgi:hypothetical protein